MARWLLAFIAAAALPFPGGPETPARPRMSEADRIRLAETFRLTGAIGDDIWPGWSETAFAVILVTPETEFLVRHPRPPSGFEPIGEDALLGSEVFARPRTFPTGFLATFPVEGVSTVVVGRVEGTAVSSSTDWVVTLLHEHFHQLQDSQPDFHRKALELRLAHGDETGMWMLDFPFPYESAPIGSRYTEAALVLKAAVSGGDPKAYLAARQDLRAALPEDDRKYLDFQIWKEGVARYTQVRVAEWAAARYRPTPAFAALPDFAPFSSVARSLREGVARELSGLKLSSDRRVVFYAYGAGEALLLDRIHPCWREDYFRNLFTLARAFAPGADCGKAAAARG